MKINWKQKLSSRKFWAAVAAWVTSLLTAFNISESVIARVVVLISGIGALAVYTLAEAYTDGKNAAVVSLPANGAASALSRVKSGTEE